MNESLSLCYVVTEMAFNAVAFLDTVRDSLAGIMAYIDKVAHNPVPEGQSSGAEGSNSTEEQTSGTEVQKFNWKRDEQKSEWIRKLETGLDAPGCYIERDSVAVMKLPDFMRKPEEHYTPQQWRFGLHNRDLQTSTTVASTTESEGLKISLAAACNLKSDRRDEVSDNRRDYGWNEFCDNVVPNPDEMVLNSYGLHPSNTTNFSKKEVQSLLTLDALTLLLVLSSLPSAPFPEEKLLEDFISWLEGGLKIGALLKDRVAYNALQNDLFLFENQIPMNLLNNVISKCCCLVPQEQNSASNTFQKLTDPQSPLRKRFLHRILMNLVRKMCIDIFENLYSDKKPFLIDANYPVGSFENCAHIFACVYQILTTFHIKEESSTTPIGVYIFDFVYKYIFEFVYKYIFDFVYKILPTFHIMKESASDREQHPHVTSSGNSGTVLVIRETSPIDSAQPGDCQSRMSGTLESIAPGGPAVRHPGPAIPGEGVADAAKVEKQLCSPQTETVKKENLGEKTLGSATDLKKAGLSIKANRGMIKAVAFKNGCLFLPFLQLNDKTESYFRNLAMYEVYGRNGEKSTEFSDYLKLMFQLIKTQEDVAYLIDECKVIRNLLVTHQNAFKMWERLQCGIELSPTYSEKFKTDIVIPVNRQQRKLQTKLNKLKSKLKQMRTEFYNKYCSKPWLAISVISGFLLLLATLIQTYVSVIGSDKMQPHFPRGG